jgi:CRP/FNR family transcriptional regulator, cyclic AMP receptor protein
VIIVTLDTSRDYHHNLNITQALFRCREWKQDCTSQKLLDRVGAGMVNGAPEEQREGGHVMRSGQVQDHSFYSHPQSAEGFLGGLPQDDLEAFEAIQLAASYPPGAVLFIEGEAPKGVFVLSKGHVKLTLASANGRVMILRIVKPGEILGLHAVISNVGYQATAETVEPCKVNFVRSGDFLRFLREHSRAALLAARQLSASYQETCHQLRAIGLSGCAREKVARFLLEWAEHGEKRQEGIRARLTLTHEEIGQLIGASRETISRILGDFKERHWIAIRGSMLFLQDKAALEGLMGDEAIAVPATHSPHGTRADDGQPFPPPFPRSFGHPRAYALGTSSPALHG